MGVTSSSPIIVLNEFLEEHYWQYKNIAEAFTVAWQLESSRHTDPSCSQHIPYWALSDDSLKSSNSPECLSEARTSFPSNTQIGLRVISIALASMDSSQLNVERILLLLISKILLTVQRPQSVSCIGPVYYHNTTTVKRWWGSSELFRSST